ncbi:MAG: penicillin-binding protein 2 [Candidatus Omnitrophica bacterium CG11_big_fil_rev_8_21_14_0_20_45_26]|uniref:Penicillin-binding protein 2 n=1 Tax=Candidatus Abzuiibacterium crystallinum TaxID=1974748 RepID=A0A2H0LP74_9BACT|nr:MAG: penicillin-binding protein 2 [Candidatus Omnitrophica bacterium CG11_big_fil_rev_8_21_14_0_20_45_26]PIW65269.1 MAG: penicillin-binding protein 2 [Candidatus Omnitrophica bacterium CG12_big_fil_rev_8_21_14_0_65_45_16]
MNYSKRLALLKFVLYGSSLALILSLFHHQVIQGKDFRQISERNRIRLIPTPAPRGNIYDRNGLLIATNRPAYHVYITPEDFNPKDLPELSQLLDMPVEGIREQIHVPRYKSLTPVEIKSDVSKEVAMQIEERSPNLAGVFIQTDSVRYYPWHYQGHTVGYIGKITREEYETLDRDHYGLHSVMGRAGLERRYDATLRGEDGGRQIEVNAKGQQLRVLSEKPPVSGHDLTLSLDVKLEQALLPLIKNKTASIAMMNLKTGEMEVFLSTPDFDPNVFVEAGKDEERIHILKDKDRPLIHRASYGSFPPGSVFKLVTAIAGLETGKITRNSSFFCPGYYQLTSRSRRFKCWDSGGHGQVELLSALEQSCNVYFYQLGRLIGEKDLSRYAHILGFGEPVPFEAPASNGLIPSAQWKQKRFGEQWYLGETLNFAIGQGYVLVSPLQILRLVGVIATNGNLVQPTLIHQAEESVQKFPQPIANKEVFKVIRQGMLQVVESRYGTGQLARIDFMRLAAKTGTAQVPPQKTHAWFAGFFPYEDPQYAMVVFVEHGGSGGLTAAALARQAVGLWKDLEAADRKFQKPALPALSLEPYL